MTLAAHLDFETYSECDIRKAGTYRYARHPSTEVLIASYWLPGMRKGKHQPRVWLPLEQDAPDDLLDAADNPDVEFYAHNAQFERAVWRWALRRMHDVPDIPPERWCCTAVLAAAHGLARGLENALEMLGTGVAKNPEGKKLIRVFCNPRKPTKANPSTRILPADAPEEFRRFVRYCQDDVLGELELHEHLPPLPLREQQFYTLDMRMNERGLPIDIPLVHKTQQVLQALEQDIRDEVHAITGGIKATQGAKLLDFLEDRGLDLDNLQAQTVRDALPAVDDPELRRLLQLRIEAGKASTKKLASMTTCADPDEHIVQGGFLMNGAHTGRYAGRLIQPQNFIRGTLKPVQQAVVFALLEHADPDLFRMLYEWPIDVIGQCMRGFIRAPAGHWFVVVDYTAIEARVLAWVAGEHRVLQAYRDGIDVYKLMASSLFGVPVDAVDSEQRRLGKNLVLGCGYSLGGDRFVEYCAGLGQHVEPAFAKKAVKLYRQQHPAIVQSWKDVEQAAAGAIRNPGQVFCTVRCDFVSDGGWLSIRLPSGRKLRYRNPKATPVERYGKPAWSLSFLSEYNRRIVRETTYGGKLVENIVQGIARDVMREGMFSAEAAGYPVVGTVHDELITLRKRGEGSVEELQEVVCRPAKWMHGIPLNSEGFTCERYRKG